MGMTKNCAGAKTFGERERETERDRERQRETERERESRRSSGREPIHEHCWLMYTATDRKQRYNLGNNVIT